MILTPLHKLPNNAGDLGKINVATCFEWLPKVKKSPNLVTLHPSDCNGAANAHGTSPPANSRSTPFSFSTSMLRPIFVRSKTFIAYFKHREHCGWLNIALWFCLRLPSCGPTFKSQAHHPNFFNLYY